MRTQTVTSCTRNRTVGDPGGRRDARNRELVKMVEMPWTLRVDGATLTVRPSRELDLPALAYMHRRCSARSLLDRYRAGGRQPSVLALDRQVRQPLSFVAEAGNGAVVATAVVTPDPRHSPGSAEVAILVEDAWQRLGIGMELMTHAAGAAVAAGYGELVAYPGPEHGPAQRLMISVGRTWMVPDDDMHMHTALNETAIRGLGAVRAALVG